MAKTVTRVAVEDLWPSTIYHLFWRPRGTDWVPQWMTPKEVDGEIELEANPDECHLTDNDSAIEELRVKCLRRKKDTKSLNWALFKGQNRKQWSFPGNRRSLPRKINNVLYYLWPPDDMIKFDDSQRVFWRDDKTNPEHQQLWVSALVLYELHTVWKRWHQILAPLCVLWSYQMLVLYVL